MAASCYKLALAIYKNKNCTDLHGNRNGLYQDVDPGRDRQRMGQETVNVARDACADADNSEKLPSLPPC